MARSSHQVSQNVDNFLRDKPSTRLHCPPGGGSSVGSLIFGGGCDESPFAGHERRGSLRRQKEETPETNPYAAKPAHAPAQAPVHSQAPFATGDSYARQSSSNQYASGANQNAGNVITDRRITRIHAPPGGASSFRLG
ncbi:hypothetical protein P43SY_008990 [Pythium insidiosum]|uniref:Uncharacterized protein n=1 Tax=Pythium insidiosum TaxID=114742 RepID=A0AAD5LXS8_PYTIN|nr:hypothetical protein P43SY_008990 [Pythium insidiosum]KAJ0398945.1 hypothetical protein ATCC90586_000179 [Pythium insidiosum]